MPPGIVLRFYKLVQLIGDEGETGQALAMAMKMMVELLSEGNDS